MNITPSELVATPMPSPKDGRRHLEEVRDRVEGNIRTLVALACFARNMALRLRNATAMQSELYTFMDPRMLARIYTDPALSRLPACSVLAHPMGPARAAAENRTECGCPIVH
jgi:hypothetical protein